MCYITAITTHVLGYFTRVLAASELKVVDILFDRLNKSLGCAI